MSDQEKMRAKVSVLEEWEKLSQQEKTVFNTPASAAVPPAASVGSPSYPHTNSISSSPWVSMLRAVAIVVMVLGIIASFIYGGRLVSEDALRGLLVMLLGSVGSVLSVAGIMVFLNMADDLRIIRTLTERNFKG